MIHERWRLKSFRLIIQQTFGLFCGRRRCDYPLGAEKLPLAADAVANAEGMEANKELSEAVGDHSQWP